MYPNNAMANWEIISTTLLPLLKANLIAIILELLCIFCFPTSINIKGTVGFTVESFFNWDSLHARLNSHYEAWSYKKKKHKNIKAYRKSV